MFSLLVSLVLSTYDLGSLFTQLPQSCDFKHHYYATASEIYISSLEPTKHTKYLMKTFNFIQDEYYIFFSWWTVFKWMTKSISQLIPKGSWGICLTCGHLLFILFLESFIYFPINFYLALTVCWVPSRCWWSRW